jgi:hypothetical protein
VLHVIVVTGDAKKEGKEGVRYLNINITVIQISLRPSNQLSTYTFITLITNDEQPTITKNY